MLYQVIDIDDPTCVNDAYTAYEVIDKLAHNAKYLACIVDGFIEKITLLKDWDQWNNNELCFTAVKRHGWDLQYVKTQTPEICLEAVRQHGYALRYVKNQTDELCIEAVRQNAYTLRYVKNQTDEICLEAVKLNGYALAYVINQTIEICLEAVKQNSKAVNYIKDLHMRNACLAF